MWWHWKTTTTLYLIIFEDCQQWHTSQKVENILHVYKALKLLDITINLQLDAGIEGGWTIPPGCGPPNPMIRFPGPANKSINKINLLWPTGYGMNQQLEYFNCTLCPHCIYLFCVYLRPNSDSCNSYYWFEL
jgi:hypothetical protein